MSSSTSTFGCGKEVKPHHTDPNARDDERENRSIRRNGKSTTIEGGSAATSTRTSHNNRPTTPPPPSPPPPPPPVVPRLSETYQSVSSHGPLSSLEQLWCSYFSGLNPEKFFPPEERVHEGLVNLSLGTWSGSDKGEEEWSSSASSSSSFSDETVVLIGDEGSGKTSFLQLLIKEDILPTVRRQKGREPGWRPSCGLKRFSAVVERHNRNYTLSFLDCAGHEVYQCVHARRLIDPRLFIIVWNLANWMGTEKFRGITVDPSEGGGEKAKGPAVETCLGGILAQFPDARFLLVATHLDQVHSKEEVRSGLTRMRERLEKFVKTVFPHLAISFTVGDKVGEKGEVLEEKGEKQGKGGGDSGSSSTRSGPTSPGDTTFPRPRPSSPSSASSPFSSIPLIVGNFAVSCTKNNELYQEFPSCGYKKGAIEDYMLHFLLDEIQHMQRCRSRVEGEGGILVRSLQHFIGDVKGTSTTRGKKMKSHAHAEQDRRDEDEYAIRRSFRPPPHLIPASKLVEGAIYVKKRRSEPLEKSIIRKETRAALACLHKQGTVFWLEQYALTMPQYQCSDEESVMAAEGEVHFSPFLDPSKKDFHSFLPSLFNRGSPCSLCASSTSSASDHDHRKRSTREGGGEVDCCCKGMVLLQPDVVFDFIYIIFSYVHVLATPRALRWLIHRPNYSISQAEEHDQLLCRNGYLRLSLVMQLCGQEMKEQTGVAMGRSDVRMFLSFLVELGLGYPVLIPGEVVDHSSDSNWSLLRKWLAEMNPNTSHLTNTIHTNDNHINGNSCTSTTTVPRNPRDTTNSAGVTVRNGEESNQRHGKDVPTVSSSASQKSSTLLIFIPSISPAVCPEALQVGCPLLFSTGTQCRYSFKLLPRALWHRWQCSLHPYLHHLAAPEDLPWGTEKERWEDMALFPSRPLEAREHHNRWVDGMWLRLAAVRRVPRDGGEDDGGTTTTVTTRTGEEKNQGRGNEKGCMEQVEEIRGLLYRAGSVPCRVFFYVSEPETSPLTKQLFRVVEGSLDRLLKEFPGVQVTKSTTCGSRKSGDGGGGRMGIKAERGMADAGVEERTRGETVGAGAPTTTTTTSGSPPTPSTHSTGKFSSSPSLPSTEGLKEVPAEHAAHDGGRRRSCWMELSSPTGCTSGCSSSSAGGGGSGGVNSLSGSLSGELFPPLRRHISRAREVNSVKKLLSNHTLGREERKIISDLLQLGLAEDYHDHERWGSPPVPSPLTTTTTITNEDFDKNGEGEEVVVGTTKMTTREGRKIVSDGVAVKRGGGENKEEESSLPCSSSCLCASESLVKSRAKALDKLVQLAMHQQLAKKSV